jgi:hypothetical protein
MWPDVRGDGAGAGGSPHSHRAGDGEAFGFVDSTGQVDAHFLSGDGRRGGDLELWFRLHAVG